MNREGLVERLFEVLISGDRAASRQVVAEAGKLGLSAEQRITEMFWPTYQLIERLHRGDQLSTLHHHLASRLLRVLVDQNAATLTRSAANGRTVMAFCGPSDSDDLGAQMGVDLLDAAGFSVSFAGGGIANDEILARVNEERPDVLLMFCSAAPDLPHIRALIDTLHEIGACPGLQIAVGGGVFNRAEGLAEEIGADVWATEPIELAERLIEEPKRRATSGQRTVGRTRKAVRAA